MRVTVILSTYNSPQWLEKVIWGYTHQSHQDFDMVVADDGSTPDTAALIRRLTDQTGLRISHLWHEDRGFRKCTILNKAVLAAAGDYLVFSDGDCIPRHDFLEHHVSLAEPGCILSGGAVRLPIELSRRITVEDVRVGRATDPSWLRANGLRNPKYLLRLTYPSLWAKLFGLLSPTRATFNGGNASVWKSDLLDVNGFDERMEYGGEDRELGERLINAGIRPKQVRHLALCLHLDHPRSYIRQEALRNNWAIRQESRRNRTTWTEYGIDQHLTDLSTSDSKVA